MLKNIFSCRVCGYISSEPPYGEDGNSPTFDYCACCGVEYGYQDVTPESTRWFRKKWVDGGYIWDEPKLRPMNWDLEEQLKNVSEEFQ
jgi:hypothetical protein